MAFTTATAAKTASDGVSLSANPVIGSLTETLINTEIAVRDTKVTDSRIYTATFTLDADVNGKTSPVDIIQSDDSRIVLDDLIRALNDAGYRTSYKSIKTRSGKPDKVNLTIAWD